MWEELNQKHKFLCTIKNIDNNNNYIIYIMKCYYYGRARLHHYFFFINITKKKKIRLRDSYPVTNILRVSGRDFICEWIYIHIAPCACQKWYSIASERIYLIYIILYTYIYCICMCMLLAHSQ